MRTKKKNEDDVNEIVTAGDVDGGWWMVWMDDTENEGKIMRLLIQENPSERNFEESAGHP